MSFKGDLSSLRAFSSSLRGLGSGILANRVAAIAAPKITALAKQTFDASQQADGTPWLPDAGGKRVTLRKSGAMVRALRYVAIGPKLRVALTTSYAKYQIGKRPVFPTQGSPLPKPYRDELAAASREALLEEFK